MHSRDHTRRRRPTDPGEPRAHSRVRRTGVIRDAAVLLGGLAIALALTPVLFVVPAGAEHIGSLWLPAVLWTVLASLAQAVWQGVSRGDWSAFRARDCSPNDDDFDFSTRTGRYSYLRYRANDALVRDGDPFLKNHDHDHSHL